MGKTKKEEKPKAAVKAPKAPAVPRKRGAANKPEVKEGDQQGAASAVAPVDEVLPRFENAQVLEILERDVNKQWHHCKMDDGTTKHVPIELFKPAEKPVQE